MLRLTKFKKLKPGDSFELRGDWYLKIAEWPFCYKAAKFQDGHVIEVDDETIVCQRDIV